jgi:hypothetical protein
MKNVIAAAKKNINIVMVRNKIPPTDASMQRQQKRSILATL